MLNGRQHQMRSYHLQLYFGHNMLVAQQLCTFIIFFLFKPNVAAFSFFSTLPQKKHHGLLYDFDGIHEIYVEDIAPLPCFDWAD